MAQRLQHANTDGLATVVAAAVAVIYCLLFFIKNVLEKSAYVACDRNIDVFCKTDEKRFRHFCIVTNPAFAI